MDSSNMANIQSKPILFSYYASKKSSKSQSNILNISYSFRDIEPTIILINKLSNIKSKNLEEIKFCEFNVFESAAI